MHKKAFTIIELILTMVILGIVSAIGTDIIKFSFDNQKKVEAFNALEVKSQVTMDFLTAHLNNSIKDAFRIKEKYDSSCDSVGATSTGNIGCKAVFNLDFDSTKYKQSIIFEWPAIDILAKRRGEWSGIFPTKIAEDKWTKATTIKPGKVGLCHIKLPKEGYIYFLGESSFGVSSAFIDEEVVEIDGSCLYYKETKRREVSASYAFVNNIEGLKYEYGDGNSGKIYFFKSTFKDYLNDINAKPAADTEEEKKKFDYVEKNKELLVENVSEFVIKNQNGVTKIRICLEAKGLPGSYFTPETSIKVCKTGVII